MREISGALELLPESRREVIADLVAGLAELEDTAAVALGGSWCRGLGRPDSDVDLALYYEEGTPALVGGLRELAERMAVRTPTVTDFYAWGPWVNGGAWIETASGRVDVLYRSLEQVRRVLRETSAGRFETHYGQTPTFGFHSVAYAAETLACRPLFDPRGVLAELERSVSGYPVQLRRSLVEAHLWGAEFTLEAFLRGFARRGDVYNTVGCLARVLAHLTQALFALNETWFMTDKTAMLEIEGFELRPASYGERVERVLGSPGATAPELERTVAELAGLAGDVVELAAGLYVPRWPLDYAENPDR
jgi:predicted nucleotidyltransferase